jgi:hypothetical protein
MNEEQELVTKRHDIDTESWGQEGYTIDGNPRFPGSEQLWPSGKFFRYHPERAVKEWSRTVAVLDALGGLGEALYSDPLSLALVEARERAMAELEGARAQLAGLESNSS